MKKLIISALLFTGSISAQDASMSIYYGSNESLGLEFLIKANENMYLGAGFSGTLEKTTAAGTFYTSSIKESEIELSTNTQKWGTIYATASFGYLDIFLISYNLGVAAYGQHANFKDHHGKDYHKNKDILIKPMLGINASVEIYDGFGVLVGFDTFSQFKIGINANF